MEIQALKKRVAELSKENAVLRHELSLARNKLDQIKKIA
jgi:regulator of replication initiation timing